MSIKVVGEQALLRDLRKLEEGDLKDAVFEALKEGGKIVQAEAKRKVPAPPAPNEREKKKGRTGELRDSLKIKRSKKYGWVKVYAAYPKTKKYHKTKTDHQREGSEVYYAFAVEFGTRFQEAQPFLRPSVEAKSDEVTKLIHEAALKTLKDGLRP